MKRFLINVSEVVFALGCVVYLLWREVSRRACFHRKKYREMNMIRWQVITYCQRCGKEIVAIDMN